MRFIATAAGLGAAIPAVIAYNIFTGRSERLEGELERLAAGNHRRARSRGPTLAWHDSADSRGIGAGGHLNAEVNIINLVDVMLVLLVIFMVTAPIMQSGIKVDLPKMDAPPATNPEALVITVKKDGGVAIGEKPMTLKAFFAGAADGSRETKHPESVLRAGRRRRSVWDDVAKVLDLLRLAGIDKAHLATQPADLH